MQIRKIIAGDECKIAEYEKEIFPDAWTAQDVLSSATSEGALCYCCEQEGEIVAYVLGRMIAPEGEIYRVATASTARRRGIARALISHLINEEKARGLCTLFLEVRESNAAARKLYTSLGFKEASVRRAYYKHPTENAIIMTKNCDTDI